MLPCSSARQRFSLRFKCSNTVLPGLGFVTLQTASFVSKRYVGDREAGVQVLIQRG